MTAGIDGALASSGSGGGLQTMHNDLLANSRNWTGRASNTKNLKRTRLCRLWDLDQKLIITRRLCRSQDLRGQLVHSPLYFTCRLIRVLAEHFLGCLCFNVSTAWSLAGRSPWWGLLLLIHYSLMRSNENKRQVWWRTNRRTSWKRQLYEQHLTKPRHKKVGKIKMR